MVLYLRCPQVKEGVDARIAQSWLKGQVRAEEVASAGAANLALLAGRQARGALGFVVLGVPTPAKEHQAEGACPCAPVVGR